MPEIKIKHVISFSSEDKVHKAENLLKAETYRKWKCANPGEKNATVTLQFEKATEIHSIDIGNECSAFVEVLVGRSSDSANNYQVLLVASSFMSPLESRNESNTNRVRMFGPDKLAQNLKDEKWDYVQIVCTQPFNKNITYGLTFVKFHSPPESSESCSKEPETKHAITKIGAFKMKSEDDDDDDDDSPSVGSWFGKQKEGKLLDSASPAAIRQAPSYATSFLSSPYTVPKISQKRKLDESEKPLHAPPEKKESMVTHVNKEKMMLKDALGPKKTDPGPSNVNKPGNTASLQKDVKGPKKSDSGAGSLKFNPFNMSAKATQEAKPNPPKMIMEDVVFVLSGFVNPLRSELRDKALEMGARYKGDWDDSCTHLVCAFINTPKYIQVNSRGGRIVRKEWIIDCHRKKQFLPWRMYMLASKVNKSSSEDEDETASEEEIAMKKQSTQQKFNGSTKDTDKKTRAARKKRRKSSEDEDSDSEDEEAMEDYLADTDDDSGSSGDEIERYVKWVNKKKAEKSPMAKKAPLPVEKQEKPDTKHLPLPELSDLFKQKHFYLYGDFSPTMQHDLERYITAYNGIIENFMNGDVKYVITESKWDQTFEEALEENGELIFVKPQWIQKCNEVGKLVPYQPFIVIPEA